MMSPAKVRPSLSACMRRAFFNSGSMRKVIVSVFMYCIVTQAYATMQDMVIRRTSRVAAIPLNELPRTQEEAIERGVKFYFTGEPCRNGHTSPRYTAGKSCVSCISVRNEQRKDYQRAYQAANADKIREKRKAYAIANAVKINEYKKYWKEENSKKMKEYYKAYKTAHKDRYKENGKKYRAKIADKMKIYLKEYRAVNAERLKEYDKVRRPIYNRTHRHVLLAKDHRRRARKRNASVGDDGSIKMLIKTWRGADKIKCYYCKQVIKKGDMHIDHIIPLAKDGKHAPENLVPACSSCNRRKGARNANEILSQGILL